VPYFLYNTLNNVRASDGSSDVRILQRNNEVIAMKATGISIYRMVVPVLMMRRFLPRALCV